MEGVFLFTLLAMGLATVSSQSSMRIMGGSLTNIESYPYITSLLRSQDLVTYTQTCAGSILTNRAILSAAHCFNGDTTNKWRIRAGSSWANRGGSVYITQQIIRHPNYNVRTFDSDIAIIRTTTPIVFSNTVRVGSIAGMNYQILDNQAVWAIGWGATSFGGAKSEQLRHVQIWTVNQQVCKNRYAALGYYITDNMLCSGWLDVGGRDQCQDDAGGPLIHKSVIVGVSSWGHQCGLARYPGVNTRVPRFTSWIQANA
ncbi:trypsin CFT-1-like [Vanessa cardui]|uniref:trypsin CFT-1-like n=1 Tax=Vanessa cardui TaxID=171605 RepID=UPI001F13831F|nr:trypsin CFT-1-like [Vanessa cardui]